MMTDPPGRHAHPDPQRQHGDARRGAHAQLEAEGSRPGHVLKREGYIDGFSPWPTIPTAWPQLLTITMKYSPERALHHLRPAAGSPSPVSRIYIKADKVPRVLGGLGVAILSTSKGLMTDREARQGRRGRRGPAACGLVIAMSRIGKNPIPVPGGVTVTVADRDITVKGPKGQLSSPASRAPSPSAEDGEVLLVERPDDERDNRAQHGLTRTLVANMVTRRHRRLHQGARDPRRRLPGQRPGPPQPGARPRLQPPGQASMPPRASSSRSSSPPAARPPGSW